MSTQVQDFYKASVTKNWTATTGDFNVSIKPTVVPGIIVLSPNSPTLREIVRYTAVGTNTYGDFVTVSNVLHRGLSGTTAQSHTIGEPVRMNITAEHWTEMQDDITSIIAAGLPAGALGDVMYHDGANWGVSNFNDDLLTEDKIRTATVSISSAQLLAISGNPIQLIAAPGAGKLIIVDEAIYSYTHVSTAYTFTGGFGFRYVGDSVNLVNPPISTILTTASSSVRSGYPLADSADLTILTAGTNTAVQLELVNTAPTLGDGTLKIFIKYRILTL